MLCLVIQSCLFLCDPMDYNLPGFFVHGNSSGKNTGGLACPSPGDLPNPGIEPRSSALQVDSLPSEPPGKPKYGNIKPKFIVKAALVSLGCCSKIPSTGRLQQQTCIFHSCRDWKLKHGRSWLRVLFLVHGQLTSRLLTL